MTDTPAPAPASGPADAPAAPPVAPPGLADITRVFARIGVLSFGGPAAQIALMHKELVEDRPWLTERQFLTALSFCMLLPGPEAMQLATYSGWRLAGLRGGLIAGLLFVLPGAAVILALASLYAGVGDLPLVQALFLGIKAAVIVIVLQALRKVAKKALTRPLAWAIAGAAFLALAVGQVPFPVVILAAAVLGALTLGTAPADGPAPPRVALRDTGRVVAVWGAIWLLPLAALWVVAPGGLLAEIGLFFAKLAVVTFGGAYAVLAYMVQEVVGTHGWLTTAQMMDAMGLAETTPGPLILVTEFVAFLAGAQAGGWAMGLAAAVVTLWVTFAPCFLWIFVGAPYVDWIATRPRLTGALSAITAAVVGVILNLSLWFGLHVLFAEHAPGPGGLRLPVLASLDVAALGLTVLAAGLLWGLRLDLLKVLPLMALAGLGLSWATTGI
ncbi:chromate efflux transporter [Roseicyclus persicicus]|uniref:Chromate efflux transporter n=1 Tax=Roseicyclus persicicus TaxID=2650661 RepID=A0A7X6GXU0_9RHOB|nr:chromate efflux transporter [Roseibacterium persicicum]NKX44387.1 chromate efflux transporter [Roseibacterium persicicum]